MPLPASQFANTQWKLPGFGGAGNLGGTQGVSLNYVPQQQTIGDPRNQSIYSQNNMFAPPAAPAADAAGTWKSSGNKLLDILLRSQDEAKKRGLNFAPGSPTDPIASRAALRRGLF